MANAINRKEAIRRSKWAAIFTLLGFMIFISSLIYCYYRLNSLEKEVSQKKIILSELNSEIKDLNQTINKLKYAPISELIIPKVVAVPIEGLKDRENRQIYDFTIWIDIPYYRREDIQSVEYTFEHTSYLKPKRIGREPSNGFGVSYRGWGCLTLVKLKVILKNGNQILKNFNMCDVLSWGI